jgi:hypothetical protein
LSICCRASLEDPGTNTHRLHPAIWPISHDALCNRLEWYTD